MNANDNTKERNARTSKELREERKEKEKIKRELARKEKALAEAAALLVLRKKPMRFGGRRGRMIKAADRRQAVELNKEAVNSGAALYKACAELSISKRTYNRWRNTDSDYIDKRTICERPEPTNKITPEEKEEILEVR